MLHTCVSTQKGRRKRKREENKELEEEQEVFKGTSGVCCFRTEQNARFHIKTCLSTYSPCPVPGGHGREEAGHRGLHFLFLLPPHLTDHQTLLILPNPMQARDFISTQGLT